MVGAVEADTRPSVDFDRGGLATRAPGHVRWRRAPIIPYARHIGVTLLGLAVIAHGDIGRRGEEAVNRLRAGRTVRPRGSVSV